MVNISVSMVLVKYLPISYRELTVIIHSSQDKEVFAMLYSIQHLVALIKYQHLVLLQLNVNFVAYDVVSFTKLSSLFVNQVDASCAHTLR